MTAWPAGRFRLALVLALAWITASALGPPSPALGLFPQADKLAHALAFLGLALLAEGAFPRPGWDWAKVLALLAYGLLLELLQAGLTPDRIASLGDWLADGAGVAVGVWLRPWWRGLGFFPLPQD